MGDDSGLAAARAGQQKQGSVDRQDALALLRVHVGEEVGHISNFIHAAVRMTLGIAGEEYSADS